MFWRCKRAADWHDATNPIPTMKPFRSLALLLAVPICVAAADPADEPPPPSASKPKTPPRAIRSAR